MRQLCVDPVCIHHLLYEISAFNYLAREPCKVMSKIHDVESSNDLSPLDRRELKSYIDSFFQKAWEQIFNTFIFQNAASKRGSITYHKFYPQLNAPKQRNPVHSNEYRVAG